LLTLKTMTNRNADKSSSYPDVSSAIVEETAVRNRDLEHLYDRIYSQYVGKEQECPVSTGSSARARSRISQVLKGFGLLHRMENARILDIGCGLGFMSEAFRELGAKVTGVDLSPVVVEQARTRFPDADFRCLVFPDGLEEEQAFDLIWAVDLPGVGMFESERILREFLYPCLRLLKGDGHLIIGWHTNFSGRMRKGWMNWSPATIRTLRNTCRASPPLIPRCRSVWLSAIVSLGCRVLVRPAPIYFLVRRKSWENDPHVTTTRQGLDPECADAGRNSGGVTGYGKTDTRAL
jgi:SAM-dependent methyltransferase